MHCVCHCINKIEFNNNFILCSVKLCFFSENKYKLIALVYQGMCSNGAVSLKQESKTLSTALRASSSETSFTHLMD